jgi:hypothetical protein
MENRGRIGFQEGGNAALNTVNGIPLDEFLKINYQYEKVPVTDKYGNPTFDNAGRQNFTAAVKQDYIGDNPLFDWNTGQPTKTITTEIPTVDPFLLSYNSNDPESFVKFQNAYDKSQGWEGSHNSAQMKDLMDAYNQWKDQSSNIPTVDPFSGQPVSEQEIIDLNKQMNPPTPAAGYTEEGLIKIAEDEAARLQSMMEAFNSGFYNNAPIVDPFSGQQVSTQEQAAFTQPQAEIFPQQESTGLNYLMGIPDSTPSSVSNLGRQDILNLLTSNFNNLDLQTMNEIRNNPGSFTIENPYLQAARTGIQSLSPGKVMSDVGEGLSTIYHGTADPSKAFSGSKFFATPDYQTALQYAKEGALRGTSIGNATGDVLRATAPTSQIQDLLKRGLTGTREIVLDPQAAQKLFLQGSGNLVETGNLASRLGRKAFQALPVVGAGIAGLDAYQRFNQGDYIGAGLGAASAVPGIGLPATAAQILYDVVYKPNQRN